MTKPENARQITMYVPSDLLESVDESAYQIRQRRNDRTSWIINAMREKLAREEAMAEGVTCTTDETRLREIASCYESMNEQGREWLHLTALIARGADDFK